MNAASLLEDWGRRLGAVGANLTLEAPGAAPVAVGDRPDRARVLFRTGTALAPLESADHLRLGEAYLQGEIDVEGDFAEVMKVTELLDMEPSWWTRIGMAARLALPGQLGRRRFQRGSIAFHYDRPPEFFLAWLGRWRGYAHGFYRSPDDDPDEAQARKLAHAVEALGLKPGMHVLDLGVGWGAFLEYAGLQGIHVHGITISEEQHRFVCRLIEEQRLPCTVERIDLLDYRPPRTFEGAVLMGFLEHFPDYARVAGFLSTHIRPEGRLYADFCAQQERFLGGTFMRRYVWPGSATYVDVPRLLRGLAGSGFHVHELADDTLSYAYTVRDWADALAAREEELAERFGRTEVRTFLLFLRGSQHFLERGRTQAHHLVAGRSPAALPDC